MSAGRLIVKLECGQCTRTLYPRPYYRAAPYGTLTAMAAVAGWYVDGGTVRCPDHADFEQQRQQERAYDVRTGRPE